MIVINESDLGRRVMYKHNNKKEYGVIVQRLATSNEMVYVKYGEKQYPEPTFLTDLYWVSDEDTIS